MALYELLIVTKTSLPLDKTKELVRYAGKQILRGDNKGVIRKLEDWGPMILPQPRRKLGQKHTHGRYWTMSFDLNPSSVNSVLQSLRSDPRYIQCTLTKVAEGIKGVTSLPGDSRFQTETVLNYAGLISGSSRKN